MASSLIKFGKKIKNISFIKPIYNVYAFYKDRKRNKAMTKHSIEIIRKVSDISFSLDRYIWLDYGTLLGAYRDNNIISHDIDIDLSCFIDDKDDIHNKFITSGFKLLYIYEPINKNNINKLIVQYTYLYKNVTIDLFFYAKPNNKNIITTYFFSYIPTGPYSGNYRVMEVFNPLLGFKKITFLDSTIWIPENTEEYLKENYGESFLTPDKNYDYITSAKNYNEISEDQCLAKKIILK
ncbi:hypothetical protein [Morganella morganii]|uniref:hypothetical protein n=3 Tax=Morganella morganii TaxID=582 RepID=UPI00280A22AB|nr:hypothetical protein [Morganella morganii]UEO57177.1 hypothetical protein [Morganella morganii]HDU8554840.1 hypothetical protein [Morganella morganii]HEI8463118.1 hypothetical protein [Morganella morganii]HEJ0265689.1 hypothetical protein [Morganella morganii]